MLTLRAEEKEIQKATLLDICFDEEDLSILISTGDKLLKAKAIQYSLIPKLNILLEESVSLVRRVYSCEVYAENSIIHLWPNFRENRLDDLKINYDSAYIGLSYCQ